MKIYLYNSKKIDIGLIKKTFELCFNQKFDEEYWKWRFLNNPFSEKVYIAYIIENGDLAAYYAVSPVKAEYNNKTYLLALSNMTMTHPNYRGKGYFTKLADAIKEELKINNFEGIYGFANHNSHYGFRKKLNWTDLSVVNILSLEKKIKQEYLLPEHHFGDLNEDLLKKICTTIKKNNDKITIERNQETLKWRFIKHPINKYKAIVIQNDGKAIASIIYKEFNKEIDVMEYFSIDPSINVLKSLFSLLQTKYIKINIWSNLHSHEHLDLERIGFVEREFNSYFGYIPLNNEKNFLEYKNWHYRFMDSDIF